VHRSDLRGGEGGEEQPQGHPHQRVGHGDPVDLVGRPCVQVGFDPVAGDGGSCWLVAPSRTPVREDRTTTEGHAVDVAADRSVLEERDRLRLLVANSTDMLARHAPDGSYRYVSPACRELLGYDPDELVGRSAYELIHPDDLAAVEAAHAAVLDGPRLRAVVYRIRDRQGGDVWFETTGHSIRDPDTDEIVEIQTSSRDVSWRRRVEAQLRESEQRFRLAMADAPIGMALVGLDGSWVEVNDRLCELLERPREVLLGCTFQDITHPDDLDADLGYAAQLLAGEISHYEMEKRYLRPSGEVVWALLGGSLVRDDAGEPRYFIAQIVDMTDRKRTLLALEEASCELERSNAELRRYASVVAHDLRSPLATIAGFVELILHRYGDRLDQQGSQILQVTDRIVRQMTQTVEGLLDLSRIEVDEPTFETVDLAPLLEDVIAAIRRQLDAAQAELRIGPLPQVSGDPALLRLLFQNLLSNAVQYRHPDRRLEIVIQAERTPPCWRVTVTDNGRGFDPADRDVLFEPYVRGRDREAQGGTGIGLATCRKIVERHRGTIEAYPGDPGARFEFTLPEVPSGEG
jgi:PAS domain S-box-containing protein